MQSIELEIIEMTEKLDMEKMFETIINFFADKEALRNALWEDYVNGCSPFIIFSETGYEVFPPNKRTEIFSTEKGIPVAIPDLGDELEEKIAAIFLSETMEAFCDYYGILR